jgi:predicted Rossmann fold nucleotide-binding protein DprA/Smf involved in DNA uptake
MKNLKKDLNAVNKEIKALAKKVDKLIVEAGKLEKPKVAKKPKAKIVKKKSVKKTVTKKIAVKKPATKKPTKTAVDTILGVIKRSKKGVNTAALIKKTGFNAKKVQNIIFKLKKQGKIKSEKKGIYLLA